ncbi:amidase family protein [Pseudoalteromonas sp. MMG007]|uniref:amidase family protein n=1 Tax=Pseudoalteromonas sp. MMG007 TaxID=2822684 RepID=UPI001B37A17B|nr:amidase family protein [Pseudoalteromonas sp. MMG007]MBQ4859597.1 amidase [Pseudoalteromonas sp. MMG007]
MIKTFTFSLLSVLAIFNAKAQELKTIDEIHSAYKNNLVNSQQLTQRYIDRINKINPQYNAVISVDPTAIAQAKTLDGLATKGTWAGPLHGIPVLLKDNIEAKGPLPTTAGSLALKNNVTNSDAFVVKQLRNAGAIILGKANLSEWANFRSSYSSSGWSAVGGQTHNAHDITRNPCGSSAGSAVAVALNFAPIALGTETDGSITCPASVNGVYAIKPSMGQVSRNGVIPLSSSQDTVGPMAHTLKDALLVMAVLQGEDKNDVSTHEFVLNSKELTAKITLKIGALPSDKFTIQTQQLYTKQINALKQAGHTVTEIEVTDNLDTLFADEYYILLYDFKAEINHYLSNTPKKVKTKSLEALINFNNQNNETEMPYFGQDILTQSLAIDLTNKDKYQRIKTRYRALAKSAITNLYKNNDIDIVIAPTVSPAWKTDLINGDNFKGSSSSLPAIAGSTHITLPVGKVSNLPVGLSIIANINQEQAAYTYADIIDKTLSVDTKKPE